MLRRRFCVYIRRPERDSEAGWHARHPSARGTREQAAGLALDLTDTALSFFLIATAHLDSQSQRAKDSRFHYQCEPFTLIEHHRSFPGNSERLITLVPWMDRPTRCATIDRTCPATPARRRPLFPDRAGRAIFQALGIDCAQLIESDKASGTLEAASRPPWPAGGPALRRCATGRQA
jgi:hypothetical protein